MDYKGYQIDITVLPEQPAPTFRAIFRIRTPIGTTALSGTIAGGVKTSDDAERMATQEAFRWIDAHS